MRRNPLILLIAGFTAWAVAFLVLYALQATGCRLGWDGVMLGPVSLLRLALVGGLFVTIGALLLILQRLRPADAPLVRIAGMANGAAVLAAFSFVGVLWLSMC